MSQLSVLPAFDHSKAPENRNIFQWVMLSPHLTTGWRQRVAFPNGQWYIHIRPQNGGRIISPWGMFYPYLTTRWRQGAEWFPNGRCCCTCVFDHRTLYTLWRHHVVIYGYNADHWEIILLFVAVLWSYTGITLPIRKSFYSLAPSCGQICVCHHTKTKWTQVTDV